jgi:hypothetical protein
LTWLQYRCATVTDGARNSTVPLWWVEGGVDVVTPRADEKEWTHRKIFGKLTNGQHTAETKRGLIDIIRRTNVAILMP